MDVHLVRYFFYKTKDKQKLLDLTFRQIETIKNFNKIIMPKVRLFKPSVGKEEISNIKKYFLIHGLDMDQKLTNLKKVC